MENQLDIDKALITRILSGETELFRQLINQHKNRVAAVCFNMLKEPNLAEEVGQETFVRLYKSLGKFQFGSSLSTYITRIAINLCLNKLDSIKRRSARFVVQENEHNNFSSNDDVLSNMANKQLVELSLQRLKPEDRSVVVLRMLEGYSTKETAELLGMAEGTVMSKLNRAMKKMKETLTQVGYKNG